MALVDDDALRARLGLENYVAIFDVDSSFDRSTGQPTDAMQTGVSAVIAGAEAWAYSWLPANYKGSIPETDPVPPLLTELALLYAERLSYSRNLDLLRARGRDPEATLRSMLAEANAMGARIQSAIQRVPEAPAPANVGAIVRDNATRLLTDSPDGTRNGGDF